VRVTINTEHRFQDWDKRKGVSTIALVPIHRRGGGELARLHREMDDLFNSFFGGWPTYEHKLWPVIVSPRMTMPLW
jgi:hypothetical protein